MATTRVGDPASAESVIVVSVVSSLQLNPKLDTNMRPLLAAATSWLFTHATALNVGPPAMERLVQVLPSVEVTIVPASPTATNWVAAQITLRRLFDATAARKVQAVPSSEK